MMNERSERRHHCLSVVNHRFLQASRQELTSAQWDQFFQRGPEAVIDRAKAQQEANELYQAGEKKLGTDESTFLRIMALRHCYQLQATFEEYTKVRALSC
jgi:hypothetical protein